MKMSTGRGYWYPPALFALESLDGRRGHELEGERSVEAQTIGAAAGTLVVIGVTVERDSVNGLGHLPRAFKNAGARKVPCPAGYLRSSCLFIDRAGSASR